MLLVLCRNVTLVAGIHFEGRNFRYSLHVFIVCVFNYFHCMCEQVETSKIHVSNFGLLRPANFYSGSTLLAMLESLY